MEKFNKLSVRTIISFLVSFILLAATITVLIAYLPDEQAWYKYPENIALAASGLLICLLFSVVVQYKSEIRQMNEYFENTSVRDTLTALYNRRYVDENIDRLVKSITRARGSVSLMMIDLDFFKKFNEAYGHGKGDNCLKNIARIFLQSVKRDNDVVARYGGEEFVVILPNTDEKGTHIIADRLLNNVREFNIPHENSEIAGSVTISIGAVIGGENFSLTGDDYIKKAEEALNISKQNGRNRYTLLNL